MVTSDPIAAEPITTASKAAPQNAEKAEQAAARALNRSLLVNASFGIRALCLRTSKAVSAGPNSWASYG